MSVKSSFVNLFKKHYIIRFRSFFHIESKEYLNLHNNHKGNIIFLFDKSNLSKEAKLIIEHNLEREKKKTGCKNPERNKAKGKRRRVHKNKQER